MKADYTRHQEVLFLYDDGLGYSLSAAAILWSDLDLRTEFRPAISQGGVPSGGTT